MDSVSWMYALSSQLLRLCSLRCDDLPVIVWKRCGIMRQRQARLLLHSLGRAKGNYEKNSLDSRFPRGDSNPWPARCKARVMTIPLCRSTHIHLQANLNFIQNKTILSNRILKRSSPQNDDAIANSRNTVTTRYWHNMIIITRVS
jgi:hypothetical protein